MSADFLGVLQKEGERGLLSVFSDRIRLKKKETSLKCGLFHRRIAILGYPRAFFTWVMMHGFDLSISQKVKIIDPTISFYLRTESDTRNLLRWFSYFDSEICEVFLIPYHEDVANRFIELLEQCPPIPKFMDDMIFQNVKVPIQLESYSYGWRVITNADLLLKFIYCNENGQYEINRECYNEDHVWLTRARLIKYMLDINQPLQEQEKKGESSKRKAEGNDEKGKKKRRHHKEKPSNVDTPKKAPKKSFMDNPQSKQTLEKSSINNP